MTAGIAIIRAELPTPDAVIVRCPDGRMLVIADRTLTEDHVQRLVAEAPSLQDPTHAVG